MSKGVIEIKKFNSKRQSDLENSIIDLLKEILPQASVAVDDSLWKEAIEKAIGKNAGNISEAIKEIKAEVSELKKHQPTELSIAIGDRPSVDLGIAHKNLPELLKILSAKLNVYLVGPSGSGKTHAAKQCADALEVPFYFSGAIANEYKLIGYMDANGKYVTTEFRQAYEEGGLFLFDEIDASFPQAVLAFNAALSNDFMDFPDKQVKRHDQFYCIAAANTIGLGADRQYVGRNQLDAASLDRFVFMEWPYDEELEKSLAVNETWTKYVQQVRQVVDELKIRHIISPRASIFGGQLLGQGIDKKTVEDMVLWKGLDKATVEKIKRAICTTVIKCPKDGYFQLHSQTGHEEIQNIVKKNAIIGYITKQNYSYNSYGVYDNSELPIQAPKEGRIHYKVENRSRVTAGSVIAEIVSDDE